MLFERKNESGISVILPTCRNVDVLNRALSSLLSQTLEKHLFEVIVVYSGPSSAYTFSERIKAEWCSQGANITQLYCIDPGASRARNLGIRAAKRQFMTFLDDDDYVDRRYLETLLANSGDNCIAVTGIRDFLPDTQSKPAESALRQKLEAYKGERVRIEEVPWVLGFNACKSFPANLVPAEGFRQELNSGEDVVFFAQLLKADNLSINFANSFENARYNRALTPNSVSRTKDSFDFSVTQRLDCIKALCETVVPQKHQQVIDQLIKSQAGFIERFSQKTPALREKIVEAITTASIPLFPWDTVKSIKCHLLMFCYCFPPFADTSANVAAKYLISNGGIADVVCNNMSSVRSQDADFWRACKPFIHKQAILNTPTSFSDWEAISAFATEAVQWALRQETTYQQVYSRALWIGSLVAGALFKISHPDIIWVAELSDPLSIGIDGNLREGKLTNNRTFRQLTHYLASAGIAFDDNWTLFQLMEVVTYSLANEIHFTNENQLKLMTSMAPKELRAVLEAKSIVSTHEVPARSLYSISHTTIHLTKNAINLGYFGRFYQNRNISSLIEPLEKLYNEGQQVVLNAFTPNPTELKSRYHNQAANGILHFFDPLPYLDFLSVLPQMDCLLVIDTDVRDTFEINPFLPSKYSDYKGSGSPIWGIVEEGSPLSAQSLDFITIGGDQKAIENTLRSLIKSIRMTKLDD